MMTQNGINSLFRTEGFLDKVTNQIRSYRLDGNNDLEEISDCKYYTIDDFKKESFSNSNSLSILHWNAHSIECQNDSYEISINGFQVRKINEIREIIFSLRYGKPSSVSKPKLGCSPSRLLDEIWIF